MSRILESCPILPDCDAATDAELLGWAARVDPLLLREPLATDGLAALPRRILDLDGLVVEQPQKLLQPGDVRPVPVRRSF